jgi:hypothetical protein
MALMSILFKRDSFWPITGDAGAGNAGAIRGSPQGGFCRGAGATRGRSAAVRRHGTQPRRGIAAVVRQRGGAHGRSRIENLETIHAARHRGTPQRRTAP